MIRAKAEKELLEEIATALNPLFRLMGALQHERTAITGGLKQVIYSHTAGNPPVTTHYLDWPAVLVLLKACIKARHVGSRGDRAVAAFLEKVEQVGDSIDQLRNEFDQAAQQ